MVICDFRQAATVKQSRIKALINYTETGYYVPSANHIAEVVRQNI